MDDKTSLSRSEALLSLVKHGLSLHSQKETQTMLGNRSAYVGFSDIASFSQCPRAAMLHRLGHTQASLPRLITLQRGHWFEDGVAHALNALHLPMARQLEIAVHKGSCPIRAHLDFVLAAIQPKPTIRVLEVKSCTKLPEVLYESYETQVYGQISLILRYWKDKVFSLKDDAGKNLFTNLTFPQAVKAMWGLDFPDNPQRVDLEAWVLALTMNDAKVFGPYEANEDILDSCLNTAHDIWKTEQSIRQGETPLDALPTVSGFHPLCASCDAHDGCPKFKGVQHPELEQQLNEFALWKAQKSELEDKIKERERDMKEWYRHANVTGQWINAGTKGFRVTTQSGRRSLDKDSLAEELTSIFSMEDIDIDVPALFNRHEKVGASFPRLMLN